ncbi:aldo/keto reductase [Actinospica robiniae]|uniref:aldo/keto reductase n=1 Tax=Actinospica robiniae TaxID=304901 RepID=UPI0003FFF960|nr:aldo/keto reductase [Actinospica robiniae]
MLYQDIGPEAAGLRVSRLCLGTMYFGTSVDEATAFAILDRFLDAGGSFVDTADCYNQWVGAKDGGESEELIGRWLRSRKAADRVTVATKIGCRTTVIGRPVPENFEGLSAAVVRKAALDSLRRLDLEQVGLLYAHYDDRSTPLEETVGAFAGLVEEGAAAVLGCSNSATWRIERARRIAADHGLPGYSCVQQAGSYLWPHPAPAQLHVVTDELIDYASEHTDMSILAYSPLLAGSYLHRDRPLPGSFGHAASRERLRVLDEVAAELGAPAGQVVLAWLMGGALPIIPVFGVTSVEQLEDVLGAAELTIPEELRARLDAGGSC